MKLKKLAGLCLAGIMLFTACSSGSKTPSNEVLKEMQATVQAAESFTSTTGVEMKLKTSAAASHMIIDAVVYDDAKGNMGIFVESVEASGEGQGGETAMYVTKGDKQFTSYVDMGDQWIKQELDNKYIGQALGQYDMESLMNTYLSNVNFTEDGTENLTLPAGETYSCHKFTGIITGDKVQTVAEADGAMSYFGLSGLQSKLFDKNTGANVTLWVDEATKLPIKISIDYTAAFAKLVENMVASYEGEDSTVAELGVSQYTADTYFVDINSTKDVEIPAETANAISYEEYTGQQQ